MSEKGFYADKPLQLADRLESMGFYLDCEGAAVIRAQHAETEALRADAEADYAHIERLGALLRATAVALLGPEPPLTSWSWHDLPERVAALRAERDALKEALENLVARCETDFALVAAAEREACAKVADKYSPGLGPIIAAAIRARGEKA